MAYHLVDLAERFCIFKSIDAGYQEKNGLKIDYNATYAYMVNMLVMGFGMVLVLASHCLWFLSRCLDGWI